MRHPSPDALTRRITSYFQSNPDEELSIADMATKFGCTKHCVTTAIGRIKPEGVIESVHVVRLRARGIASDNQQPSRDAAEARQTEEAES